MKVFISYSSKDEALATKIVESLEEAGLDAWYKKREILPGDNWAEKIAIPNYLTIPLPSLIFTI